MFVMKYLGEKLKIESRNGNVTVNYRGKITHGGYLRQEKYIDLDKPIDINNKIVRRIPIKDINLQIGLENN